MRTSDIDESRPSGAEPKGMKEVGTNTPNCLVCGADIRGDAQFCYNCGGSVAAADPNPPSNGSSEKPSVAAPLTPVNGESSAVGKESIGRGNNIDIAKKDRRPLTAAMLKRKRASNRQPVEVIWETPAAPSMLFVITSIGMAVLAAIILVAALYLR